MKKESSLKGSAVAALSLVFCLSSSALAQSSAGQPAAAGDDAEMAKKLSNPISDLVSVPFQFNWEQNVGPDRQTRFILNVQPVMPFALTPKLNLIARVIVPFVSQPPLSVGGNAASGVSDILTSFFFSPNTGSTLTWGAGPVVSPLRRPSRRWTLMEDSRSDRASAAAEPRLKSSERLASVSRSLDSGASPVSRRHRGQ